MRGVWKSLLSDHKYAHNSAQQQQNDHFFAQIWSLMYIQQTIKFSNT